MRKIIILILLGMLWTASISVGAKRSGETGGAKQDASELRERLGVITEEKGSVRRKLRAVKKREQSAATQLTIAEEKLTAARQKLRRTSALLAASQAKYSMSALAPKRWFAG